MLFHGFYSFRRISHAKGYIEASEFRRFFNNFVLMIPLWVMSFRRSKV